MKKFLYKTSFFIILVILVFGLLELGIHILKSQLFAENNLKINIVGSEKEYNWVNNIKGKDKVLLMGSSCVRYGLGCSKLNELANNEVSFINLAMDARDPIRSYFILKQLDLSDVKSVYLGLDPWIYTKAYYKNRDEYMRLDLSLGETYDYYMDNDTRAFQKRYRAFIAYFFTAEPSVYTENNEVPADYGSVKLTSKSLNFNDSINKWFQIEKYGWSKLQFEYLVKIANTCKKNNVDFYTFIPPKRSDFSRIYKLKCAGIHKEFVDHLVSAGFDAPILGTFDQLNKDGDYDLFVESYHLNSKGQDVYSKIFYDLTKGEKQNFNPHYSWFKYK